MPARRARYGDSFAMNKIAEIDKKPVRPLPVSSIESLLRRASTPGSNLKISISIKHLGRSWPVFVFDVVTNERFYLNADDGSVFDALSAAAKVLEPDVTASRAARAEEERRSKESLERWWNEGRE